MVGVLVKVLMRVAVQAVVGVLVKVLMRVAVQAVVGVLVKVLMGVVLQVVVRVVVHVVVSVVVQNCAGSELVVVQTGGSRGACCGGSGGESFAVQDLVGVVVQAVLVMVQAVVGVVWWEYSVQSLHCYFYPY